MEKEVDSGGEGQVNTVGAKLSILQGWGKPGAIVTQDPLSVMLAELCLKVGLVERTTLAVLLLPGQVLRVCF